MAWRVPDLGNTIVPEVYIGIDESHAHEPSLTLFTQGSDNTIDRLGSVLVEDFDDLARNQWRIHEHQGPIALTM